MKFFPHPYWYVKNMISYRSFGKQWAVDQHLLPDHPYGKSEALKQWRWNKSHTYKPF